MEQLKADLESISAAIADMTGKSPYEIEGRVRSFQDKEQEIKQFLNRFGLLPTA
ncbi:MAG: hypothetical protein HQL60_00125 [Magnetococcales bacterium]|nr:hypothetical protein [Magnetococcales bacterium]